ncbi:UNVERIFIED_CONTAM: hypothetical protein Sangu_3218200 [Sesamum angustifolium]|uniref:Uncharacterized protein n=1 Tax=Sesamum angustifolium TaxID=2727405 RepID=A0AAW2JIY6_9LAMI
MDFFAPDIGSKAGCRFSFTSRVIEERRSSMPERRKDSTKERFGIWGPSRDEEGTR